MFVVVFAALNLLIWAASVNGLIARLELLTTRAVEPLIAAVGIPVVMTGNLLRLTNHTLAIDFDCTAITLMALYVAIVVAYPLNWLQRLQAVLLGLPVIFVVNQLRLLGVAVASEYLPESQFYFVHDYLFMVVMVFTVLALWLFWLERMRLRGSAS